MEPLWDSINRNNLLRATVNPEDMGTHAAERATWTPLLEKKDRRISDLEDALREMLKATAYIDRPHRVIEGTDVGTSRARTIAVDVLDGATYPEAITLAHYQRVVQ